jgi:hypothetical protein
LPRASRTLKGNKRRAVFDRLIVPKNGYHLPDPIRVLEPDLPTQPVGKRVWITTVILYEISISYEGKPQKNVYRIPFSDIVGDPVSEEKLNTGYEFTTVQGETLLVKWYAANQREDQGLIVHNKSATGSSWYEPNWGQIYGVGLEWIACDGTDQGTIWANRHIGHTNTVTNGSISESIYNKTAPPDHSLVAVRPGLMLGNPEPYRTLWLMGQELPMRVYPAIGPIGKGCIFGFNENVMKFLTVKPPVPPVLAFLGAGTARSDAVNVKWNKDELHEGYTRIGMQVLSGANLITRTNPSYPTDGSLALISNPTTLNHGGANLSSIYFADGTGEVRIRLLLLECDASGNPQYVLNCTETVWHWAAGSNTCPISQESCSGQLPYPVKVESACGGGGSPIQTPTDPTPPSQTSGYAYYCDGSVDPSSIDTSYWVGDRKLPPAAADYIQQQYGVTIDERFWEGRNGWLNLFNKLDMGTTYTRSVITPTDFHKFLFKTLKDLETGSGEMIDAPDWQSFKVWCERSGLSCLTDLQKASLFCSYRLGVPVNFFSSAANYLEGNVLDVLTDALVLLPRGIYDWIDFNDVVSDTGGAVTGAFASDIPVPDFKAFRSFVNFEPQALNFNIGAAKAHRPVDYVKLPGTQWGAVTNVNYSQYYLPNMTDANYKPYVAAEVGIHEIGHAVSYFGLDFYGQILHEMPEWLSISGWSPDAPSKSPSDVSAHLVKTRSASETGGMPKTDANKEAPVTDYGCFHPAEDFAEAYRMYILNPVFLEQKFPKKYAFMLDKVEPMFG